jgi:hypothetical protein
MAEHAPACESYRYALFHCRRGQMDARTRIQGNKACGPLVQQHWFAIALLVRDTAAGAPMHKNVDPVVVLG